MRENSTNVSVIICAYSQERWPDLVAAIESIEKLRLPARELLLVIDHNSSLLERVRAHFPDVKAVENSEQQGLSGARNSGIRHASGNLIAFLDDDATAEPDWLERLCQCCEDERVLGAGGTVEPAWLETRPAWFPQAFNWVVGCTYLRPPDQPIVVRNPFGGCTCFRRDIFDVIGGFRSEIGRTKTRLLGCEETELCIRAKQQWPDKFFLYEPRARIHHRIPPQRGTWRYFRSRCYGEGLSKARVARYVGAKDGLASERAYTFRMLPIAVALGIRDGLLHRDLASFARAGAIISGLFLTTLGYAVGRFSRIHLAEKTGKDGSTALTPVTPPMKQKGIG